MPKRSKATQEDFIPVISYRFRITPVKSTITHVSGLPRSAILYRCEASAFWQFWVFMEGKQMKRSTKEEELEKATTQAKLIYADMLDGSENISHPSSIKTLRTIAKSLWVKNETPAKNKERHKDKVEKDEYIFERHIHRSGDAEKTPHRRRGDNRDFPPSGRIRLHRRVRAYASGSPDQPSGRWLTTGFRERR